MGPAAPINTFARIQAGFLASSWLALWLLAGWLAAWLVVGWVTELLGLLFLLEGVFGVLALLEGGLNHSLPRSTLGEAGASPRVSGYFQSGRQVIGHCSYQAMEPWSLSGYEAASLPLWNPS